MGPISSAITPSPYYSRQSHITQPENSADIEAKFTRRQSSDSKSADTSSGSLESPVNLNSLLSDSVQTTMIAHQYTIDEISERLINENPNIAHEKKLFEKVLDETHSSFEYLVMINNPHDSISQYQESYTEQVESARESYSNISQWISENAALFDQISEKGTAYTYARAELDYQEENGASRTDAINSGPKSIKS